MILVPDIRTARLLIRPFREQDLHDIHQILDLELNEAEMGATGQLTLAERAEWLRWIVLNYGQLARLNQPPYGDRAIVLADTEQLIGACGYVPCLNSFEQIPGLGILENPLYE